MGRNTCLMGGGILAALTNLCLSLDCEHWGQSYPHTVTSSCQETINPIGGKDGVSFIVQFSNVEPGTTVGLSNTDCWGNGFVVKRLGFPWSRPLCLFIFSRFLAPDCFWLNTLFLAPYFLLGTQGCFDFSSWGWFCPVCSLHSHIASMPFRKIHLQHCFLDARLHKL